MKNMTRKAMLVAMTVVAANAVAGEHTPKGWFHAGSHPKEYEMSTDRKVAHSGESSALVKCIAAKPGGFGTLLQTFKADTYRGKRVRMSGYVRSKEIGDWAGLWMRVDGPEGKLLAFDNMQQRAIKGTTDWTKYEIVLDVPDSAQEIVFGLLLSGAGQAWMDDLEFSVVGKDVPTTGGKPATGTSPAPANLNFED